MPQSNNGIKVCPMTTASISITNVSVRYPNGHTALNDVNFDLTGGTICALVGVNGSGKSTLFKSIMGLVTPTTGQIKLCNLPIKKAEEVDWQFPVSVLDVVMMGRYGYMNFLRIPKQADKDKVREAMARVGIESLANRQISELSGGQKKRVFLARSLAQESKIILLDEPFTGVDVKTEQAIMTLLLELKASGHLVLISTHNLGTIPEFCDQVVMINRTVLAVGDTQSTFTQENLAMVFGGVLRQIRIGGRDLHDDDDTRSVTILADDEVPAVFYGNDNCDASCQDDLAKKNMSKNYHRASPKQHLQAPIIYNPKTLQNEPNPKKNGEDGDD